MEWTEQERVRRESLARLRELGIDPYPAPAFPVTHKAEELAAEFQDGLEVRLAGRLMSRRIMGKASFAELQDGAGTVQMWAGRVRSRCRCGRGRVRSQ